MAVDNCNHLDYFLLVPGHVSDLHFALQTNENKLIWCIF